ncbi:MAG: LamG-like jellyroll fold domain-containing protein [Kiritimatiellia bacterium]
MRPLSRVIVFWTTAFLVPVLRVEAQQAVSPARTADPIKSVYDGYTPDFIQMIASQSGYGGALQGYAVSKEMMDFSTEKSFFTVNRVAESERANALVEAGIKKEEEGRHKEAIEIYQKVIDEFPDTLYGVSRYGVFIPTPYYCQLRILRFPTDALSFYRTKYDSRAQESYELARQRHSLEGLAEIRDTCLATSYGAPSLMTLGYSALDKGHFLEALEYLRTIWDYFPALRTQSPDLSLSIALANKMLGVETQPGEQFGLVGYWKLDEGRGNLTADSSGYGNEGVLIQSPFWVPGKAGSALRFSWTNCVEVRPSTFYDIGTGGAGFTVSLWVKLERATPHTDHAIFGKYGAGANEYLAFGVRSDAGHIGYAISTEHPTWETGQSKATMPLNVWTHIALVKTPDNMIRLYVNGKFDTVSKLKGRALKNAGRIVIGRHMHGAVDEVRLYNRPLLDREVAALAGALGTIQPTIKPLVGDAPLAVECSVTPSDEKAECLWEFGDGNTARGANVKHTYELGGDYGVTVTVTDSQGNISAGSGTVSVRWRQKDQELARRMTEVLKAAKMERSRLVVAPASPDAISADDYVPMLPSPDPLALQEPVWRSELPGSRNDQTVFTQPAVTRRSVIYRHKNIVYCRSILNGELLWVNSLGGRVKWQSRQERQYPLEGVLVQDGLVFTCMCIRSVRRLWLWTRSRVK